jgi:hypothetical protein
MPQDHITKNAFLVLDAMRRAGLPGQNDADVAARLEHLLAGVEPEDELVALTVWSERCALIHRLEQDQHPLRSKERVQVPDLMMVCKVGGSQLPVLVEVKGKCAEDRLVFPEKYHSALCEYPHILNLPLLVAWRYRTFWMLVDIGAFERRVSAYHLSLERSAKLNLLGPLLGDFSFVLGANWALRIRMKKLGLLQGGDLEPSAIQKWRTQMEKVELLQADQQIGKAAGPLFWAAMSCRLEEEVLESTEHFDLLLKPRHSELIPAWRVPIAALSFDRQPFTKPVNFFSLARSEAFPFSMTQLRESIMSGGAVVDKVWDITPAEYPSWWPSETSDLPEGGER